MALDRELRELFEQSYATERMISEDTLVTAYPWLEIGLRIKLPDTVSELRILDVGGGGSDATASFLDLGAEAYAIDPVYKSTADLKGKVRHTWKVMRENDGDAMAKLSQLLQEDALDRCIKSIKQNRDHYRTDSATSITFPDDFFDIVFSSRCVTTHLSSNYQVFSTAVSECLRVTKPGGSVQFFPWRFTHNDAPDDITDSLERLALEYFGQYQNENQDLLLAELKKRSDLQVLLGESADGIGFNTLRIKKSYNSNP